MLNLWSGNTEGIIENQVAQINYGKYNDLIYDTNICHHKIILFLFTFFLCRGTVKAAVIYEIPDLTGLIYVLVYETKPVHFLSICYNEIKWIHKTNQVYDPESEIVCDAHLLSLNINKSYNHNINSADLSDQLQNVYQVNHWMRKYK